MTHFFPCGKPISGRKAKKVWVGKFIAVHSECIRWDMTVETQTSLLKAQEIPGLYILQPDYSPGCRGRLER